MFCKKEGRRNFCIIEIIIVIIDSRCQEEHEYIVMLIQFDD